MFASLLHVHVHVDDDCQIAQDLVDDIEFKIKSSSLFRNADAIIMLALTSKRL